MREKKIFNYLSIQKKPEHHYLLNQGSQHESKNHDLWIQRYQACGIVLLLTAIDIQVQNPFLVKFFDLKVENLGQSSLEVKLCCEAEYLEKLKLCPFCPFV